MTAALDELEALDAALSSLAVKSLSDGEKSDTFKRVEIKVKVGKGGDGSGGVGVAERGQRASGDAVGGRLL
ncbi:hypothetical protein R6Q59_028131 [Mikania micrantha]